MQIQFDRVGDFGVRRYKVYRSNWHLGSISLHEDGVWFIHFFKEVVLCGQELAVLGQYMAAQVGEEVVL